MIAIAVDDEPLMLRALGKAVKASPDIEKVAEFSTCTDALEWVQANPADVAFLDIEMRGMDGLTLARKITELRPGCRIVFCTGYEQYAVAAIKLRTSGYLLKPVSAQAVQEEIDYIKGMKEKEKLLTVRCFGNFEAYARGEKLSFRRTKTKELLAFLVDRKGAGVTAREISAKLWSDNGSEEKYHNYLRQLFLDLRQTLEALGAGTVLVQSNYSYSLDPEKLDCDYYDYLKTGKPEFRGEYMMQYSWAEETCGLLWKKTRY
ncbi:MAG: response regulator [Candidatus Limivicinus sp.]